MANNFLDECTVKKCERLRPRGDNYFCPICRDRWINVCKIKGIYDKATPLCQENALLRKFQKESYGMNI